MKIKLDENVTHEAIAVLTAAGHDVHTVDIEDLIGHPDADIWAACLAERRMLVTFDLGFGDVRVYPPASHAGVVVLRLTDQQPAVVIDVLRAEALSEIAQCTHDEALQTLGRLEALGVVTRLVNRSKAFRLSDATKARFAGRIHYRARRKLEEHLELITAFLDTAPQISREEAAELLGVTPNSASRILSDLGRSGSLVPVANARGAGVRYRLSPSRSGA